MTCAIEPTYPLEEDGVDFEELGDDIEGKEMSVNALPAHRVTIQFLMVVACNFKQALLFINLHKINIKVLVLNLHE